MSALDVGDGGSGGQGSSVPRRRPAGESSASTPPAAPIPHIECCDSAKAWSHVEDATAGALDGVEIWKRLLPVYIDHALRVDAQG